jgi:multimeric flavodoxin WrbA
MNIVILNGNTDSSLLGYEEYLRCLGGALSERGNAVTRINLRDLEIGDCIGCLGCWLKTPGACVFTDGMANVIKAYRETDLVLYASPVVMGFISWLLKRALDRLLPLSHPRIRYVDGRITRTARYKKNPTGALLLWPEGRDDNECLAIIDAIFLNNRVRRHLFTRFMNTDVRKIIDAIDHI